MNCLPKRLLFFVVLLAFAAVLFPRVVSAETRVQLLTKPWKLSSKKGGPKEQYQLIDPNALKGGKTLRLTYNLKGACLLGGDASALIFDQPINTTWRYISLSRYGKNCYNGYQIVDIPLRDFGKLDASKQVGTFHTRIWHSKGYDIDILSAELLSSTALVVKAQPGLGNMNTQAKATPSPASAIFPTLTTFPTLTPLPSLTPTFTPTLTPTPFQTATPFITSSQAFLQPTVAPMAQHTLSFRGTWSIQSVSSMKETKDRICAQRSEAFINTWTAKAQELGANYVSLETPYDNPACGNAQAYTAKWINAIRKQGIRVWHRHMPLAFEGIYNASKNPSADYLALIANYIKSNPTFFQEGDIFTPIPEPQNGGINGVNYCPQNVCIFRNAADFNAWLRAAMDTAEASFATIGLRGKMKIGYFGFDGFIAWGDNNPDWDGILEDATVLKMGNITIDHYPEIVGDTMKNDLDELERRYPNIPIVIGEWGTINGTDTKTQVLQSMSASKRQSVVGFNYWHFGVGGNEELITEQFLDKPQFADVQRFYKTPFLQ
ncbi:MAG: hypothetical protein HY430_03055 [Candidatus Levybacteria bacterium]|nr:hypothetical protein [Candidatus Levybacteria bacterium]